MRIDAIHDFINGLLDKEQRGYRSPEELDRVIDRGQLRVFNHYLPQYALSAEAREALAPFVRSAPFNTQADGTFSVLPEEQYQQLTGLGVLYNDGGILRHQPVRILSEDELDARLNSQLRRPTTSRPVGEITGRGSFRLYPPAVYGGTIRFIRLPKAPRFAYNRVGRRVEYDDQNSVQLEWSERYQDKVILASLTLLGLPLSDQLVLQVGESLGKLQ